MTKKKGKMYFIFLYAGEQKGENITDICFEEGIEKESEKDLRKV